MRLKSALPVGYAKTKTLLKRVKTQLEMFEMLSERNAKHMYIERCQENPGYDCTFFSVKMPSGGRFKKGVQKQLLGISGQRVVFLDEKSKVRDIHQSFIQGAGESILSLVLSSSSLGYAKNAYFVILVTGFLDTITVPEILPLIAHNQS